MIIINDKMIILIIINEKLIITNNKMIIMITEKYCEIIKECGVEVQVERSRFLL